MRQPLGDVELFSYFDNYGGLGLKHHTLEIFKIQKTATPWVWMLTTGLATLVPLLVGLIRGDEAFAIFGALAGYFIGMTDCPGTLRHRLLMASITAVTCWATCLIGIELQEHIYGFAATLAVMTYLLGLYGGRGAEFERMILLAAIEFLIARYTTSLPVTNFPQISFYFVIAFAAAIFAILVTRLTLQKVPGNYVRVADAIKSFCTSQPERHFYAVTYVGAVLAAIFIVEYFNLSRGYWTIITVLLMVKPDRKDSLYRVCQRLFGTLVGVGVGELLLIANAPLEVFIAIVALCAFLVPYGWLKNYWLVAFGATMMVVSLLSIAQYGHIDSQIGLLRIQATVLGCAISLVFVSLASIAEARYPWKR